MAVFEITAPDGSVYEIEGDNEQGALSALRSHLGESTGANPDGTYGQPPEGMVLNPETGQMEDLQSPINPNIPQGGANALGLGVGQGAGFNLLDEASAALTVPFGGDYNYNLARMRESERRAASDHPVSYYGGSVGGALGTGAGLASGGLSATNAAINAGWRLPAVSAVSGAEGALLGGLYGAGSGEGMSERLSSARDGAKWGGALGAATPAVIAGASKAFQKVRAPFQTSPERTAAVRVLESEGIPLTAGQKTGSDWLRYQESMLGGSKAKQLVEDQGRAFTDAAMRKAGGSGLADESSLRALQSRLTQGFEDLSARNTLKADGPLLQDMVGTIREYNKVLKPEQKQIFGNIVSEIGERIKAGGGSISGADYQSIRSRLGKRAFNAAGADNELSEAYRGIRNALDSAMERSIIPQDAGQWAQLRRQYGNSKVLMNAARGAGEDAGIGIISPARLRMAASSGKNGESYVLGKSDFSKLTRAGQAAMTPLPNSGTAQRLAPTLLGGAGYAAAGPYGLLGAMAAPYVAGRGLMSGPVQNYLANQAGGQMSNQTRGLLNMLTNINASNIQRRVKAGN